MRGWTGFRSILVSAIAATVLVSCGSSPQATSGLHDLRADGLRDFVFSHALARDLADLPVELRDGTMSTGYSGPTSGYSNPNVVWVRDRMPVWGWVRTGSAEWSRLFLEYVNPFNERPGVEGIPSAYITAPPPAGAPPGAQAYRFGSQIHWLATRFAPLLLEGGNLQWTKARGDSFLIYSEKVLHHNRHLGLATRREFLAEVELRIGRRNETSPREWVTQLDQTLRGHNASAPEGELSADALAQSLSQLTGVRRERVLMMPWLPGERTGHVDIYVGMIADNIIAVPKIPANLIDRLTLDHERAFAGRVNAWLSERVGEFERAGLTVERVPMLPPKNLVASGMSSFGWDAHFLSTVNWTVSNQTAFVPLYERWMNELPQDAQEAFVGEIRAVLARHGLQTKFIGADRLASTNGSVHCVTADYPIENRP